MNIWLPYVEGGSGTDVFTHSLADGLRDLGHRVNVQRFAHHWQYFPWRLKAVPAPSGCEAIIANSWNAFAFRRSGCRLLAVEHLCVLDPALTPYRSFPQSVFHNTLVRHYERASAKAADITVAVSQYTRDALARQVPDSSPKVILNAVDCDFFHPVDSRPDRGVFRLLFVGNLSRRKGADMLPGILNHLGDSFELHYTAGLRAPDFLQGLANAHPLGKLDHQQVREAYRHADVLVFPTRLEGLPLVAMEAMACGTPVVASDSSSLPEVIRHGVTGMLCPQDDEQAFAEAIASLAYDPQRLRRMSEAARTDAVERFCRPRMAREYADLLQSAQVDAQ